eukprot:15463657-Alexandrium_andersonii.AAC.1
MSRRPPGTLRRRRQRTWGIHCRRVGHHPVQASARRQRPQASRGPPRATRRASRPRASTPRRRARLRESRE